MFDLSMLFKVRFYSLVHEFYRGSHAADSDYKKKGLDRQSNHFETNIYVLLYTIVFFWNKVNIICHFYGSNSSV